FVSPIFGGLGVMAECSPRLVSSVSSPSIRCRPVASATAVASSTAALPRAGGAGDAPADQIGAFLGSDPAHDRDPFPLLQILVMLKEMRDLVAQDDGQVLIGL